MTATTLRTAADSITARAAEMRAAFPDSSEPAFLEAVAGWLDAEAREFELLATKATAVNVLLRLADNAEGIDARVSLGYHTLEQALATARAWLGVDA